MAIAPARDNDVVALSSVLDLTAAHALKETLVEALSLHASLVVDGANVERVGTPAVQVLLAAFRRPAAGSQHLALREPSPVLCAAFEDLGLAAELASWSNS